MHDRYDSPKILEIFSYEQQLLGWQEVEAAVMRARANFKEMSEEDYCTIMECLGSHFPDVDWWKARDKDVHHDLNAFIEERMRFIPADLQRWFHKDMTSYDTEESAFIKKLLQALEIYEKAIMALSDVIREMAFKYRYTPMMAITHGQWADPETFGKRLACWYKEISDGLVMLKFAKSQLVYSKLSGFVGNYTGISPELEREALRILGFEPYYGATQIIPRTKFWPIASAIAGISKSISNISMAVRLGARSATMIYQEPFGKLQKGSSAGPQKRNPINCEKSGGMDNLVEHYAGVVLSTCETWEERDIAHSSAERVAWRDLFHASIHQIETMTKVLRGLKVYPDRMMREIVMTNGCYGANKAKEVLKELAAPYGLTAENCYRIVQLAAFNLGYPEPDAFVPESLAEADRLLMDMQMQPLEPKPRGHIRELIKNGRLCYTDMLDSSKEQIVEWNKILRQIFADPVASLTWFDTFRLSCRLQNEDVIFKSVFGLT